ncbi:hypothetical protein [Streptomyces sp. H27-C3]|uniref:hypothetical protein n=1 Tax=Streptomyces sp. H27-C3 TaxID=3046305 RepID=UPI0024B99563|nr:hypothetical protein [Streptomyces sp. H27-C3]MDJ0463124.1 hypothetical protein [Streptomyces sp. H27-C3]
MASTLRLLEYSVSRQDDPDEEVHISSLQCQDQVACAARRWSQHTPCRWEIYASPLHKLTEGAPLFRCMGCDAVRTLDEIVVAVVSDEEGTFLEISCKNSQECLLYQSSAEWRAVQERARERLDDEEGQ